jgi:hypothetical protein
MSLKTNRPRGQVWAAGNGEKCGASFVNHFTPAPPRIAIGNPREIYGVMIEKAEARALTEQDPTRRGKYARLARYLTLRLARLILRERER